MPRRPSDASILFDGKDLSQWRDKKTGGPAPWKIEDGAMISAKDDIVTTNEFGDLQLHLEFSEPAPPAVTARAAATAASF